MGSSPIPTTARGFSDNGQHIGVAYQKLGFDSPNLHKHEVAFCVTRAKGLLGFDRDGALTLQVSRRT